jgi:DUF4097 and DUF4098 domain-containing protein YvlB
MTRISWLKLSMTMIAVCLVALSGLASRQRNQSRSMTCDDQWSDGNKAQHCEIRETTIPAAAGALSVDGQKNGGISIKGADRADILVRARVQTRGDTDADAQAIATQIRVETAGQRISASGPEMASDRNWSVSYEILVPRQSDLSLTAHNGGISVADVRGKISFSTMNGGVSLARLAGSVHGQTTNGGVTVDLEGGTWDGDALDVSTTNGGVRLQMPDNYSAHLETGTTNGGMNIGFPVTVQGKITKQLSLDLGSGGPLVRVTTVNGGVSIGRKSS